MRSVIAGRRSVALAACLVLSLMAGGGGPARGGGEGDGAPVMLAVEIAGPGDALRRLRIDLSGTDGLPRSAFRTATVWTAGRATYAGVRLHDLLAHLDVGTGRITLWAANGYMAEIPVAQVRPDGALLAYARDGKRMTLRDKGPIWLLYPFDSAPRFRTETHYARSVWQLDRIEIAR